jgi:hypothetical protein
MDSLRASVGAARLGLTTDADFQSRAESAEALYFKELSGRPLLNLHYNA